jgi:hypothetical protein
MQNRKSQFIDQLLNEVSLDDRVTDGIFDMSNNTHMDVLRETLSDNYGMVLNDVKEIHNRMVEGKYPERQAYNRDGLLVTFPTPAHKQRAIQRGTHFEQNPVKNGGGNSNIFTGGQQPANNQPAQPTQGNTQSSPEQSGGNLPPSEFQTQKPETSGQSTQSAQSSPSSLPASEQPATPVSTPTPQQSHQQAGQPPLAIEPSTAKDNTSAPPPNFETQKTPEQKAAEANVVKQMMHGTDTNPSMLPSINERRYNELSRVRDFAEKMGYHQAVGVIKDAMTGQHN